MTFCEHENHEYRNGGLILCLDCRAVREPEDGPWMGSCARCRKLEVLEEMVCLDINGFPKQVFCMVHHLTEWMLFDSLWIKNVEEM